MRALPSLIALGIGLAGLADASPRPPDCLDLPANDKSTRLRCDRGFVPQAGAIPDAETTIAIARAIGQAAYGKRRTQEQEPLVTTRFVDVWEVSGKVPGEASGGSLVIRLSRLDARLIFMAHDR